MSAEREEFGDRVGLWVAARHDQRAFDQWREADSRADHEDEPSNVAASAETILAPVLRFLSDGLTAGNFAQRALAFVYVVRPDLLGGLDFQRIAEEMGTSSSALAAAVTHFRDEFPTMNGGYRASRTSFKRRALHGEFRRNALRLKELRAKRLELKLARAVERDSLAREGARLERIKERQLAEFFKQLDRNLGVDRVALGLDP